MGGFYNIVLIIYLYVVHVIICNPRAIQLLAAMWFQFNNNNNNNQNNRCYLDYLPSQNNNIPFQLKETNFSAVFVLLSKLSRSKATGLDKMSSRLLRQCPDLIAESLSYTFLIDQLSQKYSQMSGNTQKLSQYTNKGNVIALTITVRFPLSR